MSETQTETPAEPVEPAVEPVPDTEPDTQLEPDVEPDEAPEQIQHDEEDETTEDTEQTEAPAEPQGMSEKDYEIRDQKLGNENARHAKRIGEIMEEAATDLIPCPVCMDGIAGWVYLPEVAQLPPEAITRIRQLIGLPDLSTYHEATFARQCPDCGGLGEVKTGSLVNGYEVTTCERCDKTGYERTDKKTTNGHVEHVVIPEVTGPTVYGTDNPDPEVQHLRERGFTVIPPMKVPNN